MKTQDCSQLKIRYGVMPPAILFGVWLLLAVMLDNALIIGVILSPFILMMVFRPFVVIRSGNISYVSLLSDSISRQVSREDFIEKLPSMRWFLRKRDLIRIEHEPNLTSEQTID